MSESPHKQRQKMEETIADLRAQVRAGEVPRAQREADEQEKNVRDAHIDQVRGIINTEELEKVITEAADARTALADATARQHILDAACVAEERALKKHLAEHFDLFASDCMRIAEKVEENRAKVNSLIATMVEQREILYRKWQPLVAASKLQHSVPKLDIQPLPTIPLRPPGIDADGKIITGRDEWNRPLGDVGLDRSEKGAEILAQAQREQAQQEGDQDSSRAMSVEELAAQKDQHRQEREANLQAAKG
jgi:hypothetical protein